MGLTKVNIELISSVDLALAKKGLVKEGAIKDVLIAPLKQELQLSPERPYITQTILKGIKR